MGCCKPRTLSPTRPEQPYQETPGANQMKHETILQIPSCRVYLMEEGEVIELASGDFSLQRVCDRNVALATIVKVGDDLQWPLTKDEPVVKLDALHYLFSLPMGDGEPLSYGLTFSEGGKKSLGYLDSFLNEHSCFSCSSSSAQSKDLNWKEFAPKVEDYNNFLAKAIAGGTGHIVRGIFTCSNAYTNQVHKGGEMVLTPAAGAGNMKSAGESKGSKSGNGKKKNGVNNSLKRVRNLSKMTEKMSKAMLDGVGIATGSVMGPVVRSQAGKAFLSMVPGEVLLASLDAVNKVLDAAEAAEKQALSATSAAATRMVSNRFGENAGEATGDVLATAGHCAGTAWNVVKLRKAINPATTVSAGALKNARSLKT